MLIKPVKLISLSVAFLMTQMLYAAETTVHKSKRAREENANTVGVFLGGTNEEHKDKFTYGLEYHRIIKFPFGLSIIGEDIPKNIEGHQESSLIGLATLNPFKDFIAGVGARLGV
jgi:hypothetical protein